jgi:RNase P/RNase MRP subunit POP5
MVRYRCRYLVCQIRNASDAGTQPRTEAEVSRCGEPSGQPMERGALVGQKRRYFSKVGPASTGNTADAHQARTAEVYRLPLPFGERELHAALRATIESCFGDLGWCLLVPSLATKYFDAETGMAILRAPRDQYRLLWAACSLLNQVQLTATGQWVPLRVRVVHVGGSVRSCQNRMMQAMRRELPLFIDEHAVEKR